jgi:hypothetical protein
MNHIPAPPPSSPADWLARHQGLTAVLVAAAAVRAFGLTEWWLNPDEGIYYSIVTYETLGSFWDEVASNAHPPLYYLLLRGLSALTWDFVWLRASSLLFGVAFVGVAWAVARRLSGPGPGADVAGVVAGLLVAFAPGMVELSQVIRPYTLQLTLLGAALLCLLRYLDDGDRRAIVAYAALVGLAVLVHYSSVLAVGAFGVLVLHDGTERGFARPTWRAAFVVHAVPALLFAAVYLLHLRDLMGSTLAADTLAGWLEPYMIGGPMDAWLAFVGFHHILAHPWMRGAVVVLTAATIVTSAVSGSGVSRRPAVLVGGGFLVGGIAAVLGVYPLGSTRHSAWLVVLVAPALGWLVARALSPGGRRGWWALTGVVLLLPLGTPVSNALGAERAPWSPTDRVLRQSALAQMIDLLDPSASPELMVMGSQTFYLLLPLYTAEREAAVRSPDGTLFHFELGRRRVLVSEAWDLAGGPEPRSPDHLASVLDRAAAAFPELGLGQVRRATLLAGGWRPPLIDQIAAASAASPFVLSPRSVPGLHAFLLDLPALRAAYAP